jgi:repressor LexA
MKDLTDKQQQILDFIESFQDEFNMSPTISEIAEHFCIKTSSAFSHVKALERKKQLSRSSKARSINRFASFKQRRLPGGIFLIPVLGRVNAGLPFDAVEYQEQEISIDSTLLGASDAENFFALKVTGESMRDLGIHDGDIIIVEKGASVKNGDVVVALVNNEVTVKSFYRKEANIELHPANSDFQVQVYPAQMVQVQGKVRLLQRQF